MQYNKDTKQITLDLSHIPDDDMPAIATLLSIAESKQRMLLMGFDNDGRMSTHTTLNGLESAYVVKYLDTYLTRLMSSAWYEQDQKKHMERLAESDMVVKLVDKLQERFEKIERLKNIYGENWKDHLNDED
jgi:hypothetical protein